MKKSELKKLIEECITEIELQEDLSTLLGIHAAAIAIGVAGGWILYKGKIAASFFKRAFQDDLPKLKQAIEMAKRLTKYNKEIILILQKLENDIDLKQMYADLPLLDTEDKKNKYIEIANHIKSKLSPREMKYFYGLSNATSPNSDDDSVYDNLD